MEPARSKIELQTIPIKGVDPKDQINAKAKVVKICDTCVKLFEGGTGRRRGQYVVSVAPA
jgi:hypothetical protein